MHYTSRMCMRADQTFSMAPILFLSNSFSHSSSPSGINVLFCCIVYEPSLKSTSLDDWLTYSKQSKRRGCVANEAKKKWQIHYTSAAVKKMFVIWGQLRHTTENRLTKVVLRNTYFPFFRVHNLRIFVTNVRISTSSGCKAKINRSRARRGCTKSWVSLWGVLKADAFVDGRSKFT